MYSLSLKHVWAGAFALATLVEFVLADKAKGHGGGHNRSGSGEVVKDTLSDALEQPPRSVVLQSCVHLYNGSLVQTVPPVAPEQLGQFGRIDVFDGSVTTTSDPNSPQIGSVNGILFHDNQQQDDWNVLYTLRFSDNSGFSPNSSINFQGYLTTPAVFQATSNYSVTGGTGAFACAEGVSQETLVFSTPALNTWCQTFWMVVGCGINNNAAFHLFY